MNVSGSRAEGSLQHGYGTEGSLQLAIAAGSGFGLNNLPYGVFSVEPTGRRRVGVAVGDQVLDVSSMAMALDARFAPVVAGPVLNPLMAAGPPVWRTVRATIMDWLTDPTRRTVVEAHLHPVADVGLHLPFQVADYVDFYASEHHASNVGRIFRPDQAPLLPNWKHLPVGYHGRAGTVVVSGTPVRRPCGQSRSDDGSVHFGPSAKLDFEAEVGFVVGVASEPGAAIDVDRFADHVFGLCLVNDWSARDIQSFETRPLGPLLGKAFATSVSPWIVPIDAIDAARIAGPPQDPRPLPHLRGEQKWGLDIALEVRVNGELITEPPFGQMYWTGAQMLAHLTSGGASTRTGDLFASGTVSGPERRQRGCLLELTTDGTDPVVIGDRELSYLDDGDTVTITATAPGAGGEPVAFGKVSGQITAAR